MNSVEDPHKSTDEGLDAMMLGRTEGSSSSTQPMEIMGTHMDSVDASKRPADSTPPNEIASRKHMDSVDVMRLPMDICPEAMLAHTENLSDVTPLKEEKRRKTNLQHNKPKKANKMVIPQDYVCTSEDIDVVKLIMPAPKNTKFVDIGDALLSNNDLGCLTQDGMFLHDGVINAYIYCISDRGHLRDRAGGRVHLESTFVSSRLKRHGEREIDPLDHRRIVERMDKYLKNDMVFLLINVTASHWYVIVVNAKKRVIQVLDSLGAVVKWNDVTLTLRGLEKHLKIASQKKDFNIGEKWHDLDVTKWPVIEQFPEPMQTDGASYMNEFRPKLAAILYDSELNKIKGSLICAQSDKEENGSDSDIVVLPNPKRPYSSDVAEDDRVKEKRLILVHMIPTDPRMVVHELCKYIMSIQDAKLLEQEWVRSSKPYPIGLNLKKIQEILTVDRPMDNDCFNLGIRIVACDEIRQMVETDVHYMDLRFCTAMVDSTRGHKWRVKPNIQWLATLFDSWPGTPYKISSRKLVKIIHLPNVVISYVFLMVVPLMVLLPYASMGHFNLLSIDKQASSVSFLDPLSVFPSLESKMVRSHNLQLKLQRIAIYLSDTLALAQSGWDADIFSWQRTSPVGILENPDSNASRYFVFFIMLSWNGKELVHPIYTDGYELRKNFLVHVLKCHENEAEENIPAIVQQYLRSIKE